MNRCVIATLIVCALNAMCCASARAVSLSPTDDTFGYQFLPTMNLSTGGFGMVLPAGTTDTGHDTKSVLRFDVASTALTGSQVASASLNLFVIDTATTGFGASPSAGSPITVNLSALTAGSWDESTVDWSTIPSSGSPYDSLVIDGINQTVSFDATQLVKDWLDSVVPNNGLVLEGDTPVGLSPNWVYAVFSSTTGGVAPALVITPVPEPGSVVLALCAMPTLAWGVWRRTRRRRGK